MANYANLIQQINASIKTNGANQITGQMLQTILDNMVASLGAKYQYAGVATPATNPGTPDQNVFYLAATAGTYTNFGGLVVAEGEVAALKYNGAWTKDATGAASLAELNQLGQQVIYDVTKNNPTSGPNNDGKFESLSALLSDANLSTLIPIAVRCGGMSIRFIQTSDNIYVQYRLLSQNWSINTEDWSFCGDDILIDNSEYVHVYTDKDGRVLWAIKTDGSIHYGAGVPPQITEYINNKIAELSLDEYEDIVAFIGDLIEGDKTLQQLLDEKLDAEGLDPNALSIMSAIEKAEWTEVKTDAEKKILEGIKTDGTKVIDIPLEIQGVRHETVESTEWFCTDTDMEGKVIQGINRDGVFVNNSGIKSPTIDEINNKISGINKDILLHSATNTSNMCVELSMDGNNLFIAYNDSEGTEITYWFRKCMANELFTFYRVGYRLVDRVYPDTEGIEAGSGITYINSTASDNIGPLRMNDNGVHPFFATGGNHKYPEEDPIYKTAKCDSFKCFIGGMELHGGDKFYTDNAIVKVVNTLFDGNGGKDDVNLILTTPLCTETVFYKIVKNSIQVSLNHKFVENPITPNIEWYAGMQSMFNNEDYFATPKGEYIDWTASFRTYFDKVDYPTFNRILEKSTANQSYQSAYLIPRNLGNHEFLDNDGHIFSSSGYEKKYHLQITNKTIVEVGGNYTWTGVYTFFHNPINETDAYFIYDGVVDGKDVLFIDFKVSFDGNIEIPVRYIGRKISVIEKTDSVSLESEYVDANGISIESTESGSIIVQLNK